MKWATSREKQGRIMAVSQILRKGTGDAARGKPLAVKFCLNCHQLFGEGAKIGPDLTTFKRDDVGNMLVNIVNPSAEIREGFETYQVITADGRVLTGFLVDRDNQVVVLRGVDGQNISLTQDQIDEMAPIRKSLMPENQLKELSDQQVRDLLAYLRSSQPLND